MRLAEFIWNGMVTCQTPRDTASKRNGFNNELSSFKEDVKIKIYRLEYTMLQMWLNSKWRDDSKSLCIQLVFKGELQRQNKLISSERPFKIVQNETRIIKICRAVL